MALSWLYWKCKQWILDIQKNKCDTSLTKECHCQRVVLNFCLITKMRMRVLLQQTCSQECNVNYLTSFVSFCNYFDTYYSFFLGSLSSIRTSTILKGSNAYLNIWENISLVKYRNRIEYPEFYFNLLVLFNNWLMESLSLKA